MYARYPTLPARERRLGVNFLSAAEIRGHNILSGYASILEKRNRRALARVSPPPPLRREHLAVHALPIIDFRAQPDDGSDFVVRETVD